MPYKQSIAAPWRGIDAGIIIAKSAAAWRNGSKLGGAGAARINIGEAERPYRQNHARK